jgi:hypothetical protein
MTSTAIDMNGRVVAGCKVLGRAERVDRNARWRLLSLLPECGHEFIMEGYRIRAAENEGRTIVCRACSRQRERLSWKPGPRRVTNLLTETTPRRRNKGLRCRLCAGLTFRVEGPKCRNCDLEYRPEQIERER